MILYNGCGSWFPISMLNFAEIDMVWYFGKSVFQGIENPVDWWACGVSRVDGPPWLMKRNGDNCCFWLKSLPSGFSPTMEEM